MTNQDDSTQTENRLREAERQNRELRFKLDGLAAEHKALLAEKEVLRARLAIVASHAANVWFWQGEGDHPESLACPVVMSADTLRELLSRATQEST